MRGGISEQGATDLALLRAVLACRPGAWTKFVQQGQADVYAACRLAFPDAQANEAFVEIMGRLRADNFALLRAFDGRATLPSYLRIVLRDLLCQRVARLLVDDRER